ncbi:hypothetical protein DFJ63DRAFT_334727 [Scheffersomyces coipomensis]|uniref:uncharacterized protein n=1 Tax=Scheffersomyces coipomensis TaxID=1788519 RepID=UPI00315DC8DC
MTVADLISKISLTHHNWSWQNFTKQPWALAASLLTVFIIDLTIYLFASNSTRTYLTTSELKNYHAEGDIKKFDWQLFFVAGSLHTLKEIIDGAFYFMVLCGFLYLAILVGLFQGDRVNGALIFYSHTAVYVLVRFIGVGLPIPSQ